MKRIIAFEGVVTNDRRKILPGALTWPDDRIPVLDRTDGAEEGHRLVGYACDLARDGDKIVATVVLDPADSEYPEGLAMELDRVSIQVDEQAEEATLSAGLIRAVGLTHNPAWPEAGRYV